MFYLVYAFLLSHHIKLIMISNRKLFVLLAVSLKKRNQHTMFRIL